MRTKFLVFLIILCGLLQARMSHAMEFDFEPLSALCRVEVNLDLGFGRGSARGSFSRMNGTLDFNARHPSKTKGQILIDSRSLHFGYPVVAFHAHIPEWLYSSRFPEISFSLDSLSEHSWHGRELRAVALGTLSIKGVARRTSIPLSVHYYRGERRKYEGKQGDLLRLDGMIILQRSQFDLAAGSQLDLVKEDITVRLSITGASNRIRPLLPSRLFAK